MSFDVGKSYGVHCDAELLNVYWISKTSGIYEHVRAISGWRQKDGFNCGIFVLLFGWTVAAKGFLEQLLAADLKPKPKTLNSKILLNARRFLFICLRFWDIETEIDDPLLDEIEPIFVECL